MSTTKKEETIIPAQKQIHISIPLPYILMLHTLYSIPGLSVRKGLRDAVMNYILEQFKKNGKPLKEILDQPIGL